MSSIIVDPVSSKDLEFFARNIREKFGLADKAFFPVLEFLEVALPRAVNGFTYDIVEDHEIIGAYANYNPVTKVMKIRNSTYEGAFNGNGRDRFTIAHEIGHALLHDEASYNRVSDDINVPAYRNPEWQANTFASYLLMSPPLIRGMSVNEIADACGTSYQAAAIAHKKMRQ